MQTLSLLVSKNNSEFKLALLTGLDLEEQEISQEPEASQEKKEAPPLSSVFPTNSPAPAPARKGRKVLANKASDNSHNDIGEEEVDIVDQIRRWGQKV